MIMNLTMAVLLFASSSLCFAKTEMTRRQKLRIVSIVDWNFNRTISLKKSETTKLVGQKSKMHRQNGKLKETRSISGNKLKIKINRRCKHEAHRNSCYHSSGR